MERILIALQWELQTTGYTQYLLYDGHGSTRQLAEYNTDVTIVDSFSYDAYGVLLQDEDNFPPNGAQDPGKVAQQATSLLYAGEHFDTNAQQYYNRARWYDPLNGRFNRTDPFFGNLQDPQSLHKYLYAHCNPSNNIDPMGFFKFSPGILKLIKVVGIYVAVRIMIGIRATQVLGKEYQQTVNPLAKVNRWIGTISDVPPDQWIKEFMLRPDIVDVENQTVYEIKPDNPASIALGEKQIDNYIDVLDTRYPGSFFYPGTWSPPRYSYELIHIPGFPSLSVRIRTRNAGFGIIAYTVDPNPETVITVVVISYEVSKAISAKSADMARLEGHIGMASTLSVMGGF